MSLNTLHSCYVPRIMERNLGRPDRLRSKRLFGATYRLEVLATLVEGMVFTLTELHQRLSDPPSVSSLQKELKTLVAAGLLVEQPGFGAMRELYYATVPTPLWDAARSLLDGSEPLSLSADRGSVEGR